MAHLGNLYPYCDARYRWYSRANTGGKGEWFLPATWDCTYLEGQGDLALWAYYAAKQTSAPPAFGVAAGAIYYVFPDFAVGGVIYGAQLRLTAPTNGVVWRGDLFYYAAGVIAYTASDVGWQNGAVFSGTSIVNSFTGLPTGYFSSHMVPTPW